MGNESDGNDGHERNVDRGVARRQAFVEAALVVFLEQGYEAASVNEVVRRAGGSLATLYSQFRNKEGLFLAVMQELHDRLAKQMRPAGMEELPLEEGLRSIGLQFISALISPDHLASYRIIVGEGRKFPQLLQRYLVGGAGRVREIVSDYLHAHNGKNGVQIADPDYAATLFLDMMRSRYHYVCLADAAARPSDHDLREHVRKATQFFLQGALVR